MSRRNIQISELDLSKIGNRIAYIRLKAGLTQDQFSELTGITKSNISGLENHKYEPSYKALKQIIELFKVDSNWLIFGDGKASQKGAEKADGKKANVTRIVVEYQNLINQFIQPQRAKAIIESLLKLEQIDSQGVEEIQKIIEMKIEMNKSSKKTKKDSSEKKRSNGD